MLLAQMRGKGDILSQNYDRNHERCALFRNDSNNNNNKDYNNNDNNTTMTVSRGKAHASWVLGLSFACGRRPHQS